MKLFVIAALLTVAAALPAKREALETKPVAILRSATTANEDGSYSFDFASEDGIERSESGAQKQIDPQDPESVGTVMRGSYSYPSEDGTVIRVDWIADENGFQPSGAHLPVAPPMPDHVVKMLADLRAAGLL